MCLYTVPECSRLTEKHGRHAEYRRRSINDVALDGDGEQHDKNTDQWKLNEIQYVPFFLVYILYPPISSQGQGDLQTIPACIGARQGSHYKLSDILYSADTHPYLQAI